MISDELASLSNAPYDTLLAVKRTVAYEPLRAIEVPRSVLERYFPHGSRTSWAKRLEGDDGVESIPREELGPLRRRIARVRSSAASAPTLMWPVSGLPSQDAIAIR